MTGIIIIASIFIGCSIAALYTIHNLSKSNELGNSKSTLKELGGVIYITEKENNVNQNHPV